jgi:tRNA A-37 threonylcarbamoyl transferase component Bud32
MATLASTFSTLQQSRPSARDGAAPHAVVNGTVPTALAEALRAMQLLAPGDTPRETPVPGSRGARLSRIDIGWGSVCVKRADPVAESSSDRLDGERSSAEVRWLKAAYSIAPGCAPAVLGEHPTGAAFAMEYLSPEEFPSWQSRLATGQVEPWVAAEVGHLIGRLHAATAHSTAVKQQFERRNAFVALRLAPVFGAGAAANPDCAWELRRSEAALATAQTALVHGDLVPENILVGPRGPVLVDAECAHFGDPMVDAASLLAAVLVRMATHTQLRADYCAAWDAFQGSYLPHVTWEMHEHAEARVAALVPAFALAGLDASGSGPLVDDRGRAVLRALLLAPPQRLDSLREAWLEAVGDD